MELSNHIQKIERLRSTDRKDVFHKNLTVLIDGVKKGSLSKADILSFTNITESELDQLMNESLSHPGI